MNSAAVVRERAIPVARAVPAWAWLSALIGVSVLVRYAFARRMVGPWIMVDELVYSELAKNFAETRRFAIREAEVGAAYGVVYPILISPAYALFDAVPTAYAAVKAINSVAISLTALPAYLLARRMLPPWSALAAAGLCVAVPSVLYAGTVMTENAFYPLFVAAALALVSVLERPTAVRTVVFLAVSAAAFATRAQAVVLLPALLTAPLVLVALRGGGVRVLLQFRAAYATVAAGVAAVLLVAAALGRTPVELLGAYRSSSELDYDAATVARWFVYHLAELDLYLAVVPVAAVLVLIGVARRLRGAEQAFLAATVSLTFWLLLVVAAFATAHTNPPRIEERNAFYLAPLFLIALFVWVERGAPRPSLPALAAAGAAALLPAVLPYASLINVSAQSDTFAMLTLWSAHETFLIPLERMWVFVAGAGVILSTLFLAVPREAALALPALVLAYFALSLNPIEASDHGIRNASIGAHFQGSTHPDRDWVDAAVGSDADVAFLWSGRQDLQTVWQNEFFNRSVRRVYSAAGPLPGGLPEQGVLMARGTGRYLTTDAARIVQGEYVLADEALELDGRRVAADREKGLVLLRTPPCTHDACRPGLGEVRSTRLLDGVYADLWSGSRVEYTRYRCRGGTLTALVDSDPKLFREAQTVVARVGGRVVDRVRLVPTGTATLHVPLRRGGAGSCKTTFLVSPTAVPARVQSGSTDTRALGVHFRELTYRP